MSFALELLRESDVELSVAWDAARTVFGDAITTWEPDTFRIELARRRVDATDSLMAKLMGAQTCVTCKAWINDHDAFFSIALACDGIPAAADAIPHPTPEQLCWAVMELEALHGERITAEHGVDPDAVDPAVAVVLHDDGMVIAPDELAFAQDVLDQFTKLKRDFVSEVDNAWKKRKTLDTASLRRMLQEEPTTPLALQLYRLTECSVYCSDRAAKRSKQHAQLNQSI